MTITLVPFIRKDAFTGSEYKQDGLQIEMTSILYNIGAIYVILKLNILLGYIWYLLILGCLHSQVGSKDGRHTEQDMKEALTHYQCSA